MVAAKAICFKEAMEPEFRDYAHQIVANAKTLAKTLMDRGIRVVTGGTDNHIVLIDVSPLGLTGRQAEQVLEQCGISTNRNSLPNDPNGAWYTSGIRLGTPALTTVGMKEEEMVRIGNCIANILYSTRPVVLKSGKSSKAKAVVDSNIEMQAHGMVEELLSRYVPYGGIEV